MSPWVPNQRWPDSKSAGPGYLLGRSLAAAVRHFKEPPISWNEDPAVVTVMGLGWFRGTRMVHPWWSELAPVARWPQP